MRLFFEKKYYLRTSDFDCRGRLKPSAVMDLFQDIAGEHAQGLGIGMEEMLAKKLVWVLAKQKLQFIKTPPFYSKVTAQTWPLTPSRIGFQREYLLLDGNGDILVKGSSEWVVMNSETRRFARVMDIFPTDWEYRTEKNFPGKLGKIADLDTAEISAEIIPPFYDMDINGHISNIRYADYVINALPNAADIQIDSFRIDYHREVQKGCPLHISAHADNGAIIAKGSGDDGETKFSCEIILKEGNYSE